MNKKKILLTVCALVLLVAITVTGTLAYLTASTENQAVKNTFVAAGGGNIIDPDNTRAPDDVKDENGTDVTLEDGFFLVENKYSYNAATLSYDKEDTEYVTGNNYDNAAPGMEIGKNPKLTADIETGAAAYVFIEIVDGTQGNITAKIADVWTELSGVSKHTGGKVYVYNGGNFITGGDTVEINGISLLKEDKITVKNFTGVSDVVDTNTTTEGLQLGNLTFYAYACQAQGFENAADAYNACF